MTHRVTAIGEEHQSFYGVERRDENVCVRLFLRDIVIQLHRDPEANLKYLVLEVDEQEVAERVGGLFSEMDSDWFPPHVLNRKAYWIAESMTERANLALKEALLEISETCHERDLEVIGIDSLLEMREAERRWNAREISVDEFDQYFRRREAQICRNYEERIHLDTDDRVMMYFGIAHFEESRIGLGAQEFRSFVEQLARRDSNDLSSDDIYTVTTTYDGLYYGDLVGSVHTIDARRRPVGRRPLGSSILRIYDLLRGEFPDIENLGFDIDEVERDTIIILHQGSRYRLGEVFDGYLFFRDLNRWDSGASYQYWPRRVGTRDDFYSQRTSPPMLRITSLVPYMADPGNIVYLFGNVLDPVPTVSFGSLSDDNFYNCTSVTARNENLLEIMVPIEPGRADFEMAGRTVDVKVERNGAQFVLLGGFRYLPL